MIFELNLLNTRKTMCEKLKNDENAVSWKCLYYVNFIRNENLLAC